MAIMFNWLSKFFSVSKNSYHNYLKHEDKHLNQNQPNHDELSKEILQVNKKHLSCDDRKINEYLKRRPKVVVSDWQFNKYYQKLKA